MAITGADSDATGCAAPRIETARLVLRAVTPADASWIERYVSDWEVARYTARIPHPYPAGGAVDFIRNIDPGAELILAMERRDDREPVGLISVEPREPGVLETGFWIGKPFWGRGYASEALKAVAQHVFLKTDASSLMATANPDNRASIRVQEKAGLAYTGMIEIDAPARGRRVRVERRSLSRDLWEKQRPQSAPPLLLVAAVALVDVDGRVLLAQRPPGKSMAGLWEFPGGKLHAGESPEEALVRELEEELGIDTSESCLAPIAFASHRYEKFHLLMPLYVCRAWKGTPQPHEGQTLAWVRPQKLADYPMPPADLPLIPVLQDLL
jgi:8-oxo-dGTP diphosphatase